MAILAHIDMDCFFCSCEIKHKPELKGTPVIVGGTSARGVISAANYEARKFGVYSAIPGSIAKKLCPQGNFLKGNMQLYREESQNVMQVLRTFSDDIVQASVDEAYLDLTELAKEFSSLEEMGTHIKDTVKEQTGLTCSIGISECRVTAKIASDFNKPDGCTVVTNQKEFLAPLDIKKFPGIGKKSVKKYYQKNINTIGDLAAANVFTLLDIGGMYAINYQQIAKGERQAKLTHREGRKSISAERTFQEDTSSTQKLDETIAKLCEHIHQKIQDKYFKTISIKLRYKNFDTITRDYSVHTMTNSLEKIKEITRLALHQNYQGDSPIRLIGVKISNFVKESNIQTTLDSFEGVVV
jgi:nucleotidyltransferase/DNA polymerase involved in DNA repair